MKLYTKEMFLQAAEKCEVSMIDAKHIMKYIDEYVTPIELPSDEDIRKESHDYFIRGQLGFEAAADTERAFLRGVLWMRDKTLNK